MTKAIKKTSGLRYDIAIDWIELEIEFGAKTNFHTVQGEIRSILKLPIEIGLWVEPLDEGPGGAATVFRFKIQEPSSWRQLVNLVQKLHYKFSKGMPVISASLCKVTGIEIAFDIYGSSDFCVGQDSRV